MKPTIAAGMVSTGTNQPMAAPTSSTTKAIAVLTIVFSYVMRSICSGVADERA